MQGYSSLFGGSLRKPRLWRRLQTRQQSASPIGYLYIIFSHSQFTAAWILLIAVLISCVAFYTERVRKEEYKRKYCGGELLAQQHEQ